MADQAGLFREAEAVAGFAGSAMFNLLFRPARRASSWCPRLYHIRNEHLIASVAGHEIDLVACEPDPPDPARPRAAHVLEAGFTFDPRREGRYLEQALARSTADPPASPVAPGSVRAAAQRAPSRISESRLGAGPAGSRVAARPSGHLLSEYARPGGAARRAARPGRRTAGPSAAHGAPARAGPARVRRPGGRGGAGAGGCW